MPDGFFSDQKSQFGKFLDQKSQFGNVLEGLGMENVDINSGHLEYFMTIRYIL
jgi:hypothetical protein